MLNKVKNYIREVNNIIDNSLQTKSNNYQEKMNNYNKYTMALKENYLKRLNLIEKDLPLLGEKYLEALMASATQGKSYKGEKPGEIKRKIANYKKELSPESRKIFLGSLEATKEFIKYLFPQEELTFDFSIFQGRPDLKLEWGQAYCTEKSCLERVKLILRDFTSPDTKVLLIGDDDLTSLVLKSLSGFETWVIDIDEELLNYIEKKNLGIHTKRVDLNEKIPENLIGYFDAVCLHPYLNFDGIEMFFKASVNCLKKNRNSRIYMTTWPAAISDTEYMRLQKTILDMNLIFREILPNFDWYDLTEWYKDMDKTYKLSDTAEDFHEPLLEKLSDIPAITPTMYILSPI